MVWIDHQTEKLWIDHQTEHERTFGKHLNPEWIVELVFDGLVVMKY